LKVPFSTPGRPSWRLETTGPSLDVGAVLILALLGFAPWALVGVAPPPEAAMVFGPVKEPIEVGPLDALVEISPQGATRLSGRQIDLKALHDKVSRLVALDPDQVVTIVSELDAQAPAVVRVIRVCHRGGARRLRVGRPPPSASSR